MTAGPRASVLVPVFDQAAFLGRALGCLQDQRERAWEALVLDDGSHDDPAGVVTAVGDPRVRLLSWPENRGLGATLNAGLDHGVADVVAYLPADDVWDPGHLATLLRVLEEDGAADLAVSGVRHHGGAVSAGAPPGFGLQLVQVAHRRTRHRWTERAELESDDLGRLMWHRFPARTGCSGAVTCEWTDHPGQRHKAIRESFDGGLNVFRRRYRVQRPLRFSSTDSGTVDEVARYRRFREQRFDVAPDGLRILLVGELAFNPERVLALTERGHELFGLWTEDGLGDSTVGPLPFGHVRDVPRLDWREEVRRLRPDVVYALLNWRAVPLAHAVLRAVPDVPFVWHFKEAPQRSILRGQWPLLADLVTGAGACLVATAEEREWFLSALPGRLDPQRIGVLDGDLPKQDWVSASSPAAKLSEGDGDPHTAVLGRPLGLDAEWLVALAGRGVHTHLYGQVAAPGPRGEWRRWWDRARAAAPAHLHLHPAVGPQDWVGELSRYDAGWLHRFTSRNAGQIRRASWDDLNSPARLPVLLAAGLPLLQQANPGHVVAVERILRESGTGLVYGDVDDAADLLRREVQGREGSASALTVRHRHTFDAHTDALVALFRSLPDAPAVTA